MIAWKYIDKKGATIAALRDYLSMREVVNMTPQDIKDLNERMVSPRGASVSGMPNAKNPKRGEEKLVESLDELDEMQARYRDAIAYLRWFEPAWGFLTDTEQKVLREFYMTGNQKSGATSRMQLKLNFSERQVERLRSKAVLRLTLLLFGR